MKYCSHCGKEIMDEAVICVHCGCPVNSKSEHKVIVEENSDELLNRLSQRLQINGIIWIAVGILQLIIGIYFNWVIVIGVLSIGLAIIDISNSKKVLDRSIEIVSKFESLIGPITVLIINIFFGGITGIAGSIYYFAAVRGFVMSRRQAFLALESEI